MSKSGTTHGKTFGKTFARAASAAMAGLAVVGISALTKSLADARNLGLAPLKVAAKDAGVAWKVFSGQLGTAHTRLEGLGFANADVNKSMTRLITSTGNQRVSFKALGTAADLARFKNISLTDASASLSKAALGNTRALKDVGISASQLPKHFSTTGTAASRMALIMDLMQKKIGGQASAASATLGGKLDILKAKATDLSAKVGTAIIPVLSKLADIFLKYVVPGVTAAAKWFSALPESAKKAIAIAAGAIVLVVTFSKIKTAVTSLGAAMKAAAVGNPWILLAAVVALVVVLIVKNWSKIKAAFGVVAAFISKAWNATIQALRNALAWVVDKILGYYGMLLHGAASAFGWIPGIGPKLRTAAAAFDTFRKNVNNSIRGINGRTVNVYTKFASLTGAGGKIANPGAATGGQVSGPGTTTNDGAGLFRLSRNEWVVRAASAMKYGTAAMRSINAGTARVIPGMASGGPASGVTVSPHVPPESTIRSSVAGAVEKLAFAFAKAIGGSSSSIVNYARQFIGKVPYVWGGTTPAGWDCSGFTSYVYHHFGIPAPRTSQAQQLWARPSADRAGALAFFYGRNGAAEHVGLSMGNGKMINAYGTGYGTIVSPSRMAGFSGFGVPPGGFKGMARGGIISEPVIGVGRSGRGYAFGESGSETVTPNGSIERLIASVERMRCELVKATKGVAPGTASALDGVAHRASQRNYYS
jgi:cell wall-associated NlpC family hydrolase